MGRINEFLDKNKSSEIWGPIVADFDLKQCVETKDKINKHIEKIQKLGGWLFIAFIIPFTVSVICIKSLGMELDPVAFLGFFFLALSCFMSCTGYCSAFEKIRHIINDRISTIAGVENGKT